MSLPKFSHLRSIIYTNSFPHINARVNFNLGDEYFHDGEFLSSQIESVFCGDPVTA